MFLENIFFIYFYFHGDFFLKLEKLKIDLKYFFISEQSLSYKILANNFKKLLSKINF